VFIQKSISFEHDGPDDPMHTFIPKTIPSWLEGLSLVSVSILRNNSLCE
jgi:hypothetical protein